MRVCDAVFTPRGVFVLLLLLKILSFFIVKSDGYLSLSSKREGRAGEKWFNVVRLSDVCLSFSNNAALKNI